METNCVVVAWLLPQLGTKHYITVIEQVLRICRIGTAHQRKNVDKTYIRVTLN